MSQFDFYGNDGGTKRSTHSRGSWFVPLTILGLVLVGGLSLLMCFLTKDVKERPIWMMGLIFMVPAGAMFFSAMLLEFKTGAMTPSTSRKPQVTVAIIATVLTFLVGCICDAIYLYGFIRNAGVNFVMAVDRGDTITWPAYDDEAGATRGDALNDCMLRLVEKMPKYTDVGVVTYAWDALTVMPVSKMTKEVKASLPQVLQGSDNAGASFYTAIDSALTLAQNAAAQNQLPGRIILLTGGNEAMYMIDETGYVHADIAEESALTVKTVANENSRRQLIERLKAANCTLYVISPDGHVDNGLVEIVNATGGLSVSIAEVETVPEFVAVVTVDGDMLRATTVPAKALTGVMLVLEGLVVGICLSIMLSVAGQKRVQMILSPLMAVICFLMVKFMGTPDHNPVNLWWLWEGLSFLPLGVIFMTSNNGSPAPMQAKVSNDWGMGSNNSDLFGDSNKADAALGEWGEGTGDVWANTSKKKKNQTSSDTDW